MPLVLCLIFGASLVVSALLTALVRAVSLRVGFLDNPGGRKRHANPTPLGGGVAVFAATVGTTAIGWLIAANADGTPPDIGQAAGGLRFAVGVGGCALLLHLAGLYDDAHGLSPLSKLAVQAAAAAAVVVGFDLRASVFADVPWLTAAASILWIVAITNSFNFLDNMDGLCAGVAAICAAALTAITAAAGDWHAAAALAALAGALAGFLCFNFPPATIFLGDAGSQVIGFLLACAALGATHYGGPTGTAGVAGEPTWAAASAVPAPLLVLAIPLYDTCSVILIRLRAGDPIWKADNRHFSHRLRARGFSVRGTVLLVYACTLATAAGAIALGRVPPWAAALIVVWTVMVVGGLAILEQTKSE